MFGLKKEKNGSEKLTRKEKLDILIDKAAEVLVSEAQTKVPECGDFKRVFVTFTVPDTRITALLIIIPSEKAEERRIQLSVMKEHSDRMISNYYFKGTKQEILNHLSDKKNNPEMLSHILKLSREMANRF